MATTGTNDEAILWKKVALINATKDARGVAWKVEQQGRAGGRTTLRVTSPDGETCGYPVPSGTIGQGNWKQFMNRCKQIGFDWEEAELEFKTRERLEREAKQAALKQKERETIESANVAAAARAAQAKAKADKLAEEEAEAKRRKPRWVDSGKKAPRYTENHKLIEPDWCWHYLNPENKRNGPYGNNRPLTEERVVHFMDAMKNSKFVDSPEPIMISHEDELLNGQHRMWAVINTGISVNIDVTYNVDRDTFDTLDSPLVRGTADVIGAHLGIKKAGMAKKFSAALRMVYSYDTTPVSGWGKVKIPNYDARETLDRYPNLEQAITIGQRLTSSHIKGRPDCASAPSYTFCYLVLRAWPGCEKTLETFIKGFATGVGIDGLNDARNSLSRYIAITRKQAAGRGVDTRAQLMVMLKCWNAYVMGQKIPLSKCTFNAMEENSVEPYSPNKVSLKAE